MGTRRIGEPSRMPKMSMRFAFMILGCQLFQLFIVNITVGRSVTCGGIVSTTSGPSSGPSYRPLSRPSSRADNRTHWCVLSDEVTPYPAKGKTKPYKQGGTIFVNGNWFQHFPHAAEVLLPCWSWFSETDSRDRCGFLLLEGLSLGEASTWQSQLVRAMGCKVHASYANADKGMPKILGDGVFHSPNMKWLRPRINHRNYLSKPEHAQDLRRRVIPGIDAADAEFHGKGSSLQIGIINRLSDKRVILNINNIAAGLKEAMPDANITTDFCGDKDGGCTLQDQAMWFATKNVIIAVHGAALTNAIFIKEGTFVLQAFPPGFHWTSMDPLIEQSGGIALDWYEGTDPIKDYVLVKDDWAKKNMAQDSNLTLPVEEIADILLVALGRIKPSNVTKHDWR